MFLEEITNTVELESRNMECKVELNKNETINWLKTVAGFANAEGGVLYIGVEDKTNKLIGFSRKDADKERSFLIFRLMNIFLPVLIYEYKLMLEDRSICVLAYNLPTILAEKLETVISRGDQNTIHRDYFDKVRADSNSFVIYSSRKLIYNYIGILIKQLQITDECMRRSKCFSDQKRGISTTESKKRSILKIKSKILAIS